MMAEASVVIGDGRFWLILFDVSDVLLTQREGVLPST